MIDSFTRDARQSCEHSGGASSARRFPGITRRMRVALVAAFVALFGCEPRVEDVAPSMTERPLVATVTSARFAVAAEPPPLGRLSDDVRPVHYALTLEIVPEQERFAGTAEIEVELRRPREVIWMHG